MQRTASDLRHAVATRIAALEARSPEWRTWLRLLQVAGDAFADGWYAPVSSGVERPRPASGAPLLHGESLAVDGSQVAALLRRLLAAGADPPADSTERVSPMPAVALLEASIRADRDSIDSLARGLGVAADALDAHAHFLALPLLDACSRRLRASIPSHWPHPYCPVCGSHPALAEVRGLDRARLLRCGRCGSAWQSPVLRCGYCGELDHAELGSLVAEGGDETVTVETCASCRGYLKSLTVLQESPLLELALRDLETVELDLVALERGYSRPPGLGYRVDVHLVGSPLQS